MFIYSSLGWQAPAVSVSVLGLKVTETICCFSIFFFCTGYSILDLFCLPGKTQYFQVPALQTQSGI